MPTNEITAADGTLILMIFLILLIESFLGPANDGFSFRKMRLLLEKRL